MQLGEGTALRRVAPQEGSTPPLLDVVFVHGLGGDGDGTWRPKGAESWLGWLAEDLPSIAVWSLSYPAGATKWTAEGEGMAIPERASNLIPTLLYYGIGSRQTVFICHSLGGLIVKQILRHSSEMAVPEWTAVAESTLGVAFLATPHSGSNLATFVKILAVSRPTRTALALTAHCPHLKELADWYRQNAGRLGIETAAYAESRKVKRWFRMVTVVTTTSADPGIDGCITTSVDADHIDISKPSSRETDTYRGIETFLRRQLARAAAASGATPTATTALTDAGPSLPGAAAPPAELVRQIRELQAMGDLNLLDPGEVSALKIGIVNRYYGVGND
ncbi:esterase/lipase family protein [Micromonospora sp. NPDC049900]|uniref:esterase/lipase family protein n=1 Tax=Micromonospora sp. NPDC049900 TaxID=3364275 RepID=UPI00379EC159